jgi:hypothetical protein
MKRVLALGFVALVLVPTTGCKGDSPEALIKEFIGNVNELAASFENNEPADKQKAIIAKMKATGDKLNKVKVTQAEKDEIMKKHQKELFDAGVRLGTAAAKRGPEAIQMAQDALASLAKGG